MPKGRSTIDVVMTLTNQLQTRGEACFDDPQFMQDWKEIRAIGKQQHLEIGDMVEKIGRVKRNEIMETYLPALALTHQKAARQEPALMLRPMSVMFALRCAFWIGYTAYEEYQMRRVERRPGIPSWWPPWLPCPPLFHIRGS